ncbi:hypothetical protein LX32DRAFT_93490 [Colletotrichum zoysiae]|uniref:Uncharacterized protein n=1 Tax=Colletotrichum zoysiae TaxID=1216348 RepID=A0AAD9H9H2_9PEZI|nr:hypothetical protein LX32DRAFT_93490 [Colletotrichum zoysiae]
MCKHLSVPIHDKRQGSTRFEVRASSSTFLRRLADQSWLFQSITTSRLRTWQSARTIIPRQLLSSRTEKSPVMQYSSDITTLKLPAPGLPSPHDLFVLGLCSVLTGDHGELG